MAVYHRASFFNSAPEVDRPMILDHRVARTPVATNVTRVLTVAFVCLLGACSEPGKDADFSPEPDQAALSTTPAAPPAGKAMSELTYDERKLPLAAGGRCNLERANGRLFANGPIDAAKGHTLTLTGWVANVEKRQIPASVDIRLVASNSRVWKIPAPTGIARADVQSLLGGDAAFAKPGYSVDFNVAVPAGVYRTYVVFKDGDTLLACDNGRAIRVTE